jgi:hypothetical protein
VAWLIAAAPIAGRPIVERLIVERLIVASLGAEDIPIVERRLAQR